MSLRRLLQLLAARWKLVLLAAILGSLAAIAVTTYANSQIEPRFRAETKVALLAGEEESDEDVASRVSSALARAQAANSERIGNNPDLTISADADAAELIFVAHGSSFAEAEQLASTLRDAYLSEVPAGSLVDQLEQALADTTARVALLEEQLAELTPDITSDAETLARRRFLESQLSALQARAAALALELAYPELSSREPEEIEDELSGLEGLILTLTRDLEALPEEEVAQQSTEERLEQMALERRLRQEEARYLDLSLRLAGFREGSGFTNNVLIDDETASLLPLPLAAVAGFIGGAALAIAVLLLFDRVRRPILGLEDLEEVPLLGVVPPGRPDASSVEPWYPTAAPGLRRFAVQGVRAAIDGAVRRGPATVAVTGLRADADDVHALAADLASAMATSGSEVLIVDADFHEPSLLPEFGDANGNLSQILTQPTVDPEETRAYVKEALVNASRPQQSLRSLRAGQADPGASDALAGRTFGWLVAEARDLVDIAFVVTPGLDTPDAGTVASRLDHVLIVGRVGVTSETDLEEAVRSLTLRRAHPIGMVLIARKWRLGNRRPKHTSRKNRRPKHTSRKFSLRGILGRTGRSSSTRPSSGAR